MENPLRFVIQPDRQGGCHVQLVDAKNHEIIYWTENYKRLADARKAVLLAKRNVARAPVLDLYTALVRKLRRAG